MVSLVMGELAVEMGWWGGRAGDGTLWGVGGAGDGAGGGWW